MFCLCPQCAIVINCKNYKKKPYQRFNCFVVCNLNNLYSNISVMEGNCFLYPIACLLCLIGPFALSLLASMPLVFPPLLVLSYLLQEHCV